MKRTRVKPTFFNSEDFSNDSYVKKRKVNEEIDSLYDSISLPIFKEPLKTMKEKKLIEIFLEEKTSDKDIWNHFVFRNKPLYDSSHEDNISYIQQIKSYIENEKTISGSFRIYAKCTEFSFKNPTDPMHFFIVLTTKEGPLKEIVFNHYAKGYRIVSFHANYGLSKSEFTLDDTDFYIELYKGDFKEVDLSTLICDTLRFSHKHDKGNNNSVYPGTCSGLTLSIAMYLENKIDVLQKLGQSQIAALAVMKIKSLKKMF